MKASVDIRGTYREPMYEDLIRKMRFLTASSGALAAAPPASDGAAYSA